MNRLGAVLANTAEILSELGKPFALVGGLAVSARTEPRFTRHIDLVVAVSDDADAELIVHEFQGRGYTAFQLVEQEALARLAMARLIPPGESEDGIVVDLLFASSGLEPEIAAAADPVEVFEQVTVRVARTGHLLALKLLSRSESRPQDEVDLAALLRAADLGDRALAQTSVAQIQGRGFNRDRDLDESLNQLFDSV